MEESAAASLGWRVGVPAGSRERVARSRERLQQKLRLRRRRRTRGQVGLGCGEEVTGHNVNGKKEELAVVFCII